MKALVPAGILAASAFAHMACWPAHIEPLPRAGPGDQAYPSPYTPRCTARDENFLGLSLAISLRRRQDQISASVVRAALAGTGRPGRTRPGESDCVSSHQARSRYTAIAWLLALVIGATAQGVAGCYQKFAWAGQLQLRRPG